MPYIGHLATPQTDGRGRAFPGVNVAPAPASSSARQFTQEASVTDGRTDGRGRLISKEFDRPPVVRPVKIEMVTD